MEEKINEKVKQLKTDFEHFLDPLKRGRYTKIGEYQGKGILYSFFWGNNLYLARLDFDKASISIEKMYGTSDFFDEGLMASLLTHLDRNEGSGIFGCNYIYHVERNEDSKLIYIKL